MKTFQLKGKEIEKKWYVIDGQGLVVGRIASLIAKILRGKHEPRFTPYLDQGGCVIVVNASHVHFTGAKEKVYYRHTGYPGGIKSVEAKEVLKGPYPERVLKKAVERMLGRAGPLRQQRMRNFYVYGGPSHPHEAQKPLTLEVGKWNVKNCQKEAKL